MTFLAVGIDHEHVDLDLLERLSVPEHRWGKVLRELVAGDNVTEAVFLSTCLRTEVYAVIERFHGAIDEVTAVLSAETGVAAEEFADQLTVHFDRGVAARLFSVAGGLASAVPGEHEVLGQVRRALERAEEERTAGSELTELFRRAITAGRRVRHETTIARGTVSFAQATVDLAAAELGAELAGAPVVVLGAGQLASGVARSLLDLDVGVGSLAVLNRTEERGAELVAALGDPRATAGPLSVAASAARGARLVVAAVESPEPVLCAADLAGAGPLLIVDLGVPRVVETQVSALAGVRRLDIADLRAVVERTLAERHEAIDAARAIVEVEVERFHEDRRSRGAAAIVGELRDRLEQLRRAEVERRRSEFAELDEATFELVESLTRSLVAKIAHAPTVALKEAAGTDRGPRLTEAARALFEL